MRNATTFAFLLQFSNENVRKYTLTVLWFHFAKIKYYTTITLTRNNFIYEHSNNIGITCHLTDIKHSFGLEGHGGTSYDMYLWIISERSNLWFEGVKGKQMHATQMIVDNLRIRSIHLLWLNNKSSSVPAFSISLLDEFIIKASRTFGFQCNYFWCPVKSQSLWHTGIFHPT